MDPWSISNLTRHFVRSQALSGIHPQSHWSPYAFTGIHLGSHWAPCVFTGMYPHTNPQSRCPSQALSPIPAYMFLYCISYKRQHGSACVLISCRVHTLNKPPVKMPPITFLPHPWFYIFIDVSYGSACVLTRCRVQSSGILSPFGLPVSCCLAT